MRTSDTNHQSRKPKVDFGILSVESLHYIYIYFFVAALFYREQHSDSMSGCKLLQKLTFKTVNQTAIEKEGSTMQNSVTCSGYTSSLLLLVVHFRTEFWNIWAFYYVKIVYFVFTDDEQRH